MDFQQAPSSGAAPSALSSPQNPVYQQASPSGATSSAPVSSQPPIPHQPPIVPPQHLTTEDSDTTSRKFPTRIALIAGIAALVVVLFIFLLPGGNNSSSADNNLPNQRQMISDAKTVLSDVGIECKVLDLEIISDNHSERFKIYTAECTVTISSDNVQSERTLTLTYEYENDQWILVK